MNFIVYALTDPRTNELLYVGKSCSGLERPRQHRKPRLLKSRSRKNSWIKSLLAKGLCYGIEILEELATREGLDDAERFWIANFRAAGAMLLNMTDGGDGTAGRVQPPEERARRAAAMRARGNGLKGYKQTTEHRARIAAGVSGKPKAPRRVEHTRNNALAHGGKPFVDANGNLFYTVPEAASFHEVAASTVRRALKGTIKNSSQKFTYQEIRQ